MFFTVPSIFVVFVPAITRKTVLLINLKEIAIETSAGNSFLNQSNITKLGVKTGCSSGIISSKLLLIFVSEVEKWYHFFKRNKNFFPMSLQFLIEWLRKPRNDSFSKFLRISFRFVSQLYIYIIYHTHVYIYVYLL